MPEQGLGGIPIGFEIVVKDKPSELSLTLKGRLSQMCDRTGWSLFLTNYSHYNLGPSPKQGSAKSNLNGGFSISKNEPLVQSK